MITHVVVGVSNYITQNIVGNRKYLPAVRKYVFTYFLFHVYLWIILDGALNIPIFSRYLRQHYQKIIVQFKY